MPAEVETARNTMIGFKAESDLVARADAVARAEGLTRSAVARRALMRDLERHPVHQEDAA